MAYMEGFVIPVPRGNKEAYRALAAKAAPIFIEYGATRVVECWADDIKPGKINDFRTAVIAEEGEEVVFSWIEWPSREIRDAAHDKIMADERMQPEDGDMPFAGARLIYGGFSVLVDERA
ncbi:uncharacterized protein YbaA (DUF1428 family) [Sphingobium fontiphilum]|uniref:Uncharacterized protein YbaA (DUF1428 family) n=1 Tax=Sphingobium fontiphilum TaxID=944425 RepID=A0A7W6DG51_9SPHN|nr:DUF1428 domain-containing protein [Sphingobium fontiphilum]MBB3982162.1 uncharacterized protein YbaA (DUF1428 family) [Sphingobium fontiphilum]